MIIPLRAHSANGSLKRSVLNIDEYIKKAVDVGLTHLTLTDYSSMSASIEFYSKCIKAGITPIIGIEIEIINTVNINLYGNKYRVVLLAKNYNGYQRLIKIHNKIKLGKNSYINMQDVYNIGGNDLIALFPCSINPVVMAEVYNDINTIEYMLNIYWDYIRCRILMRIWLSAITEILFMRLLKNLITNITPVLIRQMPKNNC